MLWLHTHTDTLARLPLRLTALSTCGVNNISNDNNFNSAVQQFNKKVQSISGHSFGTGSEANVKSYNYF